MRNTKFQEILIFFQFIDAHLILKQSDEAGGVFSVVYMRKLSLLWVE